MFHFKILPIYILMGLTSNLSFYMILSLTYIWYLTHLIVTSIISLTQYEAFWFVSQLFTLKVH